MGLSLHQAPSRIDHTRFKFDDNPLDGYPSNNIIPNPNGKIDKDEAKLSATNTNQLLT